MPRREGDLDKMKFEEYVGEVLYPKNPMLEAETMNMGIT